MSNSFKNDLITQERIKRFQNIFIDVFNQTTESWNNIIFNSSDPRLESMRWKTVADLYESSIPELLTLKEKRRLFARLVRIYMFDKIWTDKVFSRGNSDFGYNINWHRIGDSKVTNEINNADILLPPDIWLPFLSYDTTYGVEYHGKEYYSTVKNLEEKQCFIFQVEHYEKAFLYTLDDLILGIFLHSKLYEDSIASYAWKSEDNDIVSGKKDYISKENAHIYFKKIFDYHIQRIQVDKDVWFNTIAPLIKEKYGEISHNIFCKNYQKYIINSLVI